MRGGEFDNFDFLCIISPLLERGRIYMNCKIKDISLEYFEFLKLKNKATTILNIKRKFKNYILPAFGEYYLTDITEKEYINFQLKLFELNFSESFYKQIYSIMNEFFKYLNLVYKCDNVVEKVGRIKNNNYYQSHQKSDIWTRKEFRKFIKKVDNPIYHALFSVLFYTGLRKGEVLALKISDLEGNFLNVNKTITKELFNNQRIITTPKSKTSIRKVRIDFFLKLELKKLIKYYIKNFDNYNKNNFLFGFDKPIATTTLERKKNDYCKKAKVKQIRIHDFRHSHATILFNSKVSIKTIQKRLGHADISTTLNVYVHENIEEKRLIKAINLTHF